MSSDQNLANLSSMIIATEKKVDTQTLCRAKRWYEQFTGPHAVKMEDHELVEIYNELQ